MSLSLIPDSIQPLVTWRAWNFDGSMPLQSLCSVTPSGLFHPWPAKKALQAYCPWPALGHVAPDEHCKCGLYGAALERADLLDPYLESLSSNPSAPLVIGEAFLWGKVLEHSRGLRAEFAYPKELFVLDTFQWGSMGANEVSQNISEQYGVPVSVLTLQQLSTKLGNNTLALERAWKMLRSTFYGNRAPLTKDNHFAIGLSNRKGSSSEVFPLYPSSKMRRSQKVRSTAIVLHLAVAPSIYQDGFDILSDLELDGARQSLPTLSLSFSCSKEEVERASQNLGRQIAKQM